MDKSPDAFRTISEVSEWLETPAHVLRFWESRFTQLKPVKRAGGRRYYRPADMALLGGIKKLLHDDGLTIRGVQKILREQGVRHVAALSVVGGDKPDLIELDARGFHVVGPDDEAPMLADAPEIDRMAEGDAGTGPAGALVLEFSQAVENADRAGDIVEPPVPEGFEEEWAALLAEERAERAAAGRPHTARRPDVILDPDLEAEAVAEAEAETGALAEDAAEVEVELAAEAEALAEVSAEAEEAAEADAEAELAAEDDEQHAAALEARWPNAAPVIADLFRKRPEPTPPEPTPAEPTPPEPTPPEPAAPEPKGLEPHAPEPNVPEPIPLDPATWGDLEALPEPALPPEPQPRAVPVLADPDAALPQTVPLVNLMRHVGRKRDRAALAALESRLSDLRARLARLAGDRQ